MTELTFLLRSLRFFSNRALFSSASVQGALDFRYRLIIESRVAQDFIRTISRTASSSGGYSGWVMRNRLTKTPIADLFHALQVVPSRCTLKCTVLQHGPRPGLNAFASCSVTVFFIQLVEPISSRIHLRIFR